MYAHDNIAVVKVCALDLHYYISQYIITAHHPFTNIHLTINTIIINRFLLVILTTLS